MNNNEPIILRSYGNVWDMEKIMYHFGGQKLLVPVPVRQAGYFAGTIGIIFLITRLLPFLQNINGVILYIIIPGVVSYFLNKKLLDGKTPLSYLESFVTFLGSSKVLNRYEPVDMVKGKMIYDDYISFRETIQIPKDEMHEEIAEYI